MTTTTMATAAALAPGTAAPDAAADGGFWAGQIGRFAEWVDGLGPLGYVVFIAGYIAAALAFVPGSLLTIAAGSVFGLVRGSLAVSLASTTGAALAFLIARYLARGRVERKLAGNPRFRAIDRAVGREGAKIILLLRLTPVLPFSAGNYLYGLTAVRFWPYVLASWVGMMPGTVLYVYIGALVKAGAEAAAGGGAETGKLVLNIVAFAATVAVTVFVTRIARRALREADLEGGGEPGENGAPRLPTEDFREGQTG